MIESKLEEIAAKVKQLGLAVPAVFFLEMNKPLVGLIGGACCAFDPILKAVVGDSNMETLHEVTSSVEQVEKLINLIERK